MPMSMDVTRELFLESMQCQQLVCEETPNYYLYLYLYLFIYTLTMALNASKRGFIAKEYVTW